LGLEFGLGLGLGVLSALVLFCLGLEPSAGDIF
jgi:hypothetical protein